MTDNKETTKKTAEKKPKTATRKKTRGVLLVAINHPYYGKYAFQLALSLMKNAPNLKVAIAHDGVGVSHLKDVELSMFHKVIKMKDSVMHGRGGRQLLKFKAYLYDITPFDETLFLDADMLWSPKRNIEDFMKELSKVDFTMQNRGKVSLKKKDEELNNRFIIWANSKHIKEAYGFKDGDLYNLSSELIWFKKTDKVKEYFKQVKVNFESLKVGHEDFSGGIPDELPFTIAMIQKKMYPHIENWRPIYWEAFDKQRLLLKPKEVYDKYWGVSFGGNLQENMIKKFYNNLAQYYCNQFGVQHPFPLKDKRSFIKERHTI